MKTCAIIFSCKKRLGVGSRPNGASAPRFYTERLITMSGHSKWHNIQAKKGKTDAARGKIFTKIGREIAIAVREGGSNPESNSKLRDIIAKAKSNNMPNDNIKRSIMKASGELGNVDYEEITYEGYAPGGVAVIVETITDSRNRTASDVRHCFAKNDGSLGVTGSVGFMFDKKGVLVIERTADMDEDEMISYTQNPYRKCPFYQFRDEYINVRKQI